MNKKIFLPILIYFFLFLQIFAESQGENLFKTNNPSQAVLFLEEEIENGTASSVAYNYLGLAYYQLEEYEKSIEAFEKGLKVPATNKKILSFNQGNVYYAMKDYDNAIKKFSLTLTADPKYTKALLNRANAHLMKQNYQEAINDYEKFIIMEPVDEQRPEIEELLALLKKEQIRLEEEARVRAEEEARLAEEERRLQEELERQRIEREKQEEAERLERERIAEEERIAREKEEAEKRALEEKRRAEEAERRRKLLEEVANSLQNTDSTNMSSGAEELMEYDYESELD